MLLIEQKGNYLWSHIGKRIQSRSKSRAVIVRDSKSINKPIHKPTLQQYCSTLLKGEERRSKKPSKTMNAVSEVCQISEKKNLVYTQEKVKKEVLSSPKNPVKS